MENNLTNETATVELFKKVFVKDRLPTDRQMHIFHLKRSLGTIDEGETDFNNYYCHHPEQIKEIKRQCDWWLEPVPSSSLSERISALKDKVLISISDERDELLKKLDPPQEKRE